MLEKKLTHMRIGDSGIVAGITDSTLFSRCLSIGLAQGAQLTVENITLLGHTFYIKVNRRRIALRKSEAENIIISQ